MRPNRVIEGSIHGFLRVLEHTLESEELTRRAGLLQSLDPRVKLLGFLGLIAAAAASRKLEVIGAVFGVATVLAICSQVPLGTLMIRVWAGAFAFTGLIAVPAVFLTPGRPVGRLPLLGWAVTAQGLRGAKYAIRSDHGKKRLSQDRIEVLAMFDRAKVGQQTGAALKRCRVRIRRPTEFLHTSTQSAISRKSALVLEK